MYVIYVKVAPHRKVIRAHIIGNSNIADLLVLRYRTIKFEASKKWFPRNYLLADQCPN